MPMPVPDNETLQQLAAGASGSAVSVWLARATGIDMLWMFMAGTVSSHYIAPAVALYFSVSNYTSAVGFWVGFLAIILMRKLLSVIDSVSGESIGGVLVQALRRFFGVKDADH